MRIWKQLYAMIWLVFLQIILITLPRFTGYLVEVHAALGLAILILALYDNSQIKKTECPIRLKRIAKSTAILAIFQAVLGIVLMLDLKLKFGMVDVVGFLHLVMSLAIITQAASVATAYDMWEEHEFVLPPKTQ